MNLLFFHSICAIHQLTVRFVHMLNGEIRVTVFDIYTPDELAGPHLYRTLNNDPGSIDWWSLACDIQKVLTQS